MKKAWLILSIFTIGFLLNLIWENLHAPLFKGFTNFWDHFMICFWASLVDAATILLLYGLVVFWYKDLYWFRYMNWKTALVLIVAGGTIAVGFEYWAFAINYWTYAEEMPVVPYLGIGLSPLLQMMLLPLLTFILVAQMSKSKENRRRPLA